MADRMKAVGIFALAGAALGAGAVIGFGLKTLAWGVAFGVGAGIALGLAAQTARPALRRVPVVRLLRPPGDGRR